MTPELHHKWNAERDPDRGSKDEVSDVSKKQEQKNKITLKQNRPR